MKIEEGTVVELNGDIAQVRVGKHSDCQNCGACPGSDAAIISLRNSIGAKQGQRVTFEVRETNTLRGAFMVFVLPLIFIFIGVFAGKIVGGLLGVSALTGQIIGGVLFLLIAIILIRLFDNSVRKKEKSMPEILKITK